MPNMHLIYPDTNIWNYLAQPATDETALFHSLASKDASLVLSSNAVYELARTFTGKGGEGEGGHHERRPSLIRRWPIGAFGNGETFLCEAGRGSDDFLGN